MAAGDDAARGERAARRASRPGRRRPGPPGSRGAPRPGPRRGSARGHGRSAPTSARRGRRASGSASKKSRPIPTVSASWPGKRNAGGGRRQAAPRHAARRLRAQGVPERHAALLREPRLEALGEPRAAGEVHEPDEGRETLHRRMLRVELPRMKREDGRMAPAGGSLFEGGQTRAARRRRNPQLPPAGIAPPEAAAGQGRDLDQAPARRSSMRCGPSRFRARPSGGIAVIEASATNPSAARTREPRSSRRADRPLGRAEELGADRRTPSRGGRGPGRGPRETPPAESSSARRCRSPWSAISCPRRAASRHEIGMALGDPAQNEDGGAVAAAVEARRAARRRSARSGTGSASQRRGSE